MESDSSIIVIIAVIILLALYFIYRRYNEKKFISTPEYIELRETKASFYLNIEAAKKDYISSGTKKTIKDKYKIAYQKITKEKGYNSRIEFKQFLDTYRQFDDLINEWNREYVSNEMIAKSRYFSNIDGKSLDDQQRRAVVVDEDNNLIVAGAGSGKTLTLSAKVKYLTEMKGYKPDEILLLSFTRKASDEMQDRITKRLGIQVDVKTFHKLGLEIISQSKNERPDIFDDIKKILKAYFDNDGIDKHDNQKEKVLNFFGIYFAIPANTGDAQNLGEVIEKNQQYDFASLKSKFDGFTKSQIEKKESLLRERMRSIEEVMIANYLFLHGVNYSYERLYPFEQDDPFRKKYRPDFYLDDYDIYIEHFGINQDNKAPWLSEIEERKYLDGMEWKRKFHKQNHTKLIETYSHYSDSGQLLQKLDKKLRDEGVEYKPVDFSTIYNRVFTNTDDPYIEQFKQLVETFIHLFKSRGFNGNSFAKLYGEANQIKNAFLHSRTVLFISIIEPIFHFYQKYLDDLGQIDFDDMINKASECINQGKYKSRYKYILVDEYQDISYSRYRLLVELKAQTQARLFAVGDDWQSIYRFTGSDISLFSNFSKYFGDSELLRIEKTYRNSQELVDLAGKFVMRNSKQIAKQLKSDKRETNPIRIIGYQRDIALALNKSIDDIIRKNGSQTSIMILGRHNFDINLFEQSNAFKIIKRKERITVQSDEYPELRIEYSTVHKAKGLEADNTIIINMRNNRLGFPNQMVDDPLLALVLSDRDDYEFAEERRLFYVALTRTKSITYLLVPAEKQSIFAQEIINLMNVKFRVDTNEPSTDNNPNCPKCMKGTLLIREQKSSQALFLGCTNYPHCDFSTNHIEIVDYQVFCSRCGGFMIKRQGKYGEFFGCINYPLCSNTINIESNNKSWHL